MKLYIKNKLFSLRGSSAVLDENRRNAYIVKGKFFSLTRKKRICDLNGRTLYSVRNKWFNFWAHKAFILDADKNKIARVKDKPFNFKNDFIIENYKDEIKIEGGFFSLTCQIVKNGTVIGVIRRNIISWTDSFELEANEADMPFLIALVIAIDNIVDNKRK